MTGEVIVAGNLGWFPRERPGTAAGIRPEVTSLSDEVLLSWGDGVNELTLSRYTAASHCLRQLRIQYATMINKFDKCH